jgi:hypothetical protein
LKAAKSEVPFGDVHVAWNDQGLLLATIAMDYYDPELLGELDPFPRSEAFRIALGLDAGSGARSIELRVVPEAVVRYANKETRLEFRVEICRYEAGDACAAVPGAVAHYFGTALDQPRIILKALIPWSALGGQGPSLNEMDVDRRSRARDRHVAPGDLAGGCAGRFRPGLGHRSA